MGLGPGPATGRPCGAASSTRDNAIVSADALASLAPTSKVALQRIDWLDQRPHRGDRTGLRRAAPGGGAGAPVPGARLRHRPPPHPPAQARRPSPPPRPPPPPGPPPPPTRPPPLPR